jgi:hypothetical protein
VKRYGHDNNRSAITAPHNYLTQQPGGQCLDVNGYGTTDGSTITANRCHPWDKDPAHQNQGWKWQTDGTLTSTLSGLCVDTHQPAAQGSAIWIKTCNGASQQKWTYNKTDSTIRHTASGTHTQQATHYQHLHQRPRVASLNE